jgi:hypothetical protein
MQTCGARPGATHATRRAAQTAHSRGTGAPLPASPTRMQRCQPPTTHAAADGSPSTSSPSQPPPLYARLTSPVYSLATAGGPAGAPATLNLVTYASPVAIQPRSFALGLYLGTQSYANMRHHRRGVLQVRCSALRTARGVAHARDMG